MSPAASFFIFSLPVFISKYVIVYCVPGPEISPVISVTSFPQVGQRFIFVLFWVAVSLNPHSRQSNPRVILYDWGCNHKNIPLSLGVYITAI